MNAPVEREEMEVDVLFVGAGPATLASAYHLMKTCEARGIEAPIVLTNVVRNAGLSPDDFRVELPPGTEIIKRASTENP